ncbi:hypothetical protein KFU94_45700 [Chloroflexi bacterium TSY]|nr:hypothetical protein [Chloroflexi bacterium TSY]
MSSFADLLTTYTQRTGITDAELARSIGVRRQTIFRWKEGLVARPRNRDDVLRCARRLRLTADELDELLIAAGFQPESSLERPVLDQDYDQVEIDEKTDGKKNGTTNDQEDLLQSHPTESKFSSTEEGSTLAQDERDRNGEDVRIVATKSSSQDSLEEEKLQGRQPLSRSLITVGILVVAILTITTLWFQSRQETAALIETPPSPTTQRSPTATTIPTATSFRRVAAPGEVLLLIAPFENYASNVGFNLAGRLRESMEEQIAASEMISTTVHRLQDAISNSNQAAAEAASRRATMLIWGQYDSGRVLVNFTIPGARQERLEKELPSPDDLLPTINEKVPEEVKVLTLFFFSSSKSRVQKMTIRGEILEQPSVCMKNLYPTFAATVFLGLLHQNAGRIEEARKVLDQAATLQSSDDLRSTLYFYLGKVYSVEPTIDYARAIRHYTRSIELRSRHQSANPIYNRGNVYLERYRRFGERSETALNDLAEAIKDYTETLSIKPRYVKAYINRGIAYYLRNQSDDVNKAMIDFDRAIALEPDDHKPYYNRALAKIRAGEVNGWQADLEKTLEITPTFVSAYTAFCWGHTLDQQLEQALPHCKKALELNPSSGANYDSLGIVYALSEKPEAAIAEFEKYLAWLKKQPSSYYERYNGPTVEEWIAALEAGE